MNLIKMQIPTGYSVDLFLLFGYLATIGVCVLVRWLRLTHFFYKLFEKIVILCYNMCAKPILYSQYVIESFLKG